VGRRALDFLDQRNWKKPGHETKAISKAIDLFKAGDTLSDAN
jgi:hypothetical protein